MREVVVRFRVIQCVLGIGIPVAGLPMPLTAPAPVATMRPIRGDMTASGSTDPSARPDHESGRLDSWKEIAAYLNRSVTTVQRWEQEEGLPVHRLVHAKGGSVYALTHELDLWRGERDPLLHREHAVPSQGETLELDSEAIPPAPAQSFSPERVPQEKRWWAAAVGRRSWRVSLFAVVTLAALASLLPWPVASARILSVRPLVSDLERFGGRLRTNEACENPYANWSWASDHERVYLAMPRRPGQAPEGSYALYELPIAGGEPVEIPLPFHYEVRVLDYVPEQSSLLVRGASESQPIRSTEVGLPLWLVSTAGGAPRRIPNLLGNWGDVAPDGRTLALIRNHQEGPPRLILAQTDGSNIRDLGPVATDVIRPRWAPDGSRLRFFRRGPARNAFEDSIWERGIEGGAPRSLWPGSRGDWTPDGRYFVYDREEPGAFRQDLFAQTRAALARLSSAGSRAADRRPSEFLVARCKPRWSAAVRVRSLGARRVDAARSENQGVCTGARGGVRDLCRPFT